VFLIGDSFSASLALGLRPLLDSKRINLFQVSTGGCEPTDNEKHNTACSDINALVDANIASSKPDVVIFNSNWLVASRPPYFRGGGDYFEALVSHIEKLKQRGAKQVIVVGQVPTWKKALPVVLTNLFAMHRLPIPERTFRGVVPDSLKIDDAMAAIHYPDGTTYLSVRKLLCDDGGCLTTVGPDLGKDLVVWDYGHLTEAAAQVVADKLFGGLIAQLSGEPDEQHPLDRVTTP
jgi:hypothetical protein